MPEEKRRPFATGSKPGPDAVDHYLETQGFYRKHVARDASSLFRVVSEHVFDVQNYHEMVRQDCAEFMEAHHKDYSNEVDKNFYNYVSNLRKPRTHGSLLELRVLARKYRKNVILFEPTQNLQTTSLVYVQNDEFNENPPMRVFYSHKDKHFDVIFTMDYVERLAECQAIVYDLLYSTVYRLPDVQYAVERMLHDQEERVTLPLSDDPSKYKKQSGDIISFDSHDETSCVLKDPKTCHFHNQINFEEVVNENKDSITVINRTDDPGRLKIFKPIDGFLHDKEKSCVRQLLDEKITPFPYKVAKALDPSIYRNTEFELWSENRKEQRMKWLDSQDFPIKQHFDDKWIVYDRRRKYFDSKFEHGVVDEAAYMALDDDMKKKYVVLDPSAEPFKLHHLTGLSNFMPSKDSLELTVMPAGVNYNRDGGRGNYRGKRGGGRNHNYNGPRYPDYQNRSYNNQQGQQMTSVTDIESREQVVESQETQQVFYAQQTDNYEFEQQSQQQQQQVHQVFQQIPANYYQQPPTPQYQYAQPLNYHHVMPYGNFSIPPPQAIAYPAVESVEPATGGDLMKIIRESDLGSSSINFTSPKESNEANGGDLPMNDIPTLQFYYNLGVRYFLASGVHRRLENVASQLENLEINENSSDKSGHKVEPPPVPTNTPVSTKQVGGSHGNRYQNTQHNNSGFRRQFNNNSGGGGNYRNFNNHNPRKDFKFNSNVKNVHKVEPKLSGSSAQNPPQEKLSPTASATNPQYSPISPISQEPPAIHFQQPLPVQEFQPQQQQQQFFAYPQQQFIQPQQPGVGIIYQVNEEGYLMQPYTPQPYRKVQGNDESFVMQPVQSYQPMQAYPAAYQQFPQPQQAQFVQQPQVYYPVQQPQVMDGSTMSSNDSGMVEPQIFNQQAQPAAVQYFQPYPPAAPPLQVYYTPTPLPQTPQIAQVAPVFPVPQEVGVVTQTNSSKSQKSDGSGDAKKTETA